jgi:SM-20-related protein
LHTDFLSKTLSNGLIDYVQELISTDELHSANIGNLKQKDETQKIRTDKIYWLDKKHENVFEKKFLMQMENFIDRLNCTCYTGINAYEFHYAVYEVGTYYKKHKDQFKSDNQRKFSMISYLNKDWLVGDGGNLVLYPNAGPQSITPNTQTTVFFKSDEMEHEVTTTNKQRLSITGWLKVE